jgi:hypothetical protein
VDHPDVFDAVKRLLQRLDPLAEEQRGKTGGDADQKRDEPELICPGPFWRSTCQPPRQAVTQPVDLVPDQPRRSRPRSAPSVYPNDRRTAWSRRSRTPA